MAYDEHLASRLREALADADGISEQKMFGGLALLRHGNMICGVMGDELMLRLGPELADAALDEPEHTPDGLHRPADEEHGHRRTARFRR